METSFMVNIASIKWQRRPSDKDSWWVSISWGVPMGYR